MSSVPPLDVERGTIRVGIKTFLAIVVGLITATVGGVTVWGQMAKKNEVEVLQRNLEAQLKLQADALKEAREVANENAAAIRRRDTERLAARIDFLVEAQLEEARTSPRAKRAVDRAMRKIKAQAKANGKADPLADLSL